jgi:hypothetical protein
MSSGFRRVVVQVKAVRDLSEQGTKTRVYVRSRLDTSVPLVNNDDTTFATNVIEVTRKSPGPYTFLEESGDVNVFELPDFVVVCDVMKVGGGCFNTGKDERIATVRIPLAKVELDMHGQCEMWYTLHYPAKLQSAKRGRYAGKLLVSISMEQRPPRTFQIETYTSPGAKSPTGSGDNGAHTSTMSPVGEGGHFTRDSPPLSASTAQAL